MDRLAAKVESLQCLSPLRSIMAVAVVAENILSLARLGLGRGGGGGGREVTKQSS